MYALFMQGYRLKCRNSKCGAEFHRAYKSEEFDRLQYSSDGSGISCFNCGFPRMVVMKSNKTVDDGFKPGFQRNIRKHCSTYAEYKAHLKNMGLIEIGYDDLPPQKETLTNYFDDDMMRKLYSRYGISLDSRKVDHLQGKI